MKLSRIENKIGYLILLFSLIVLDKITCIKGIQKYGIEIEASPMIHIFGVYEGVVLSIIISIILAGIFLIKQDNYIYLALCYWVLLIYFLAPITNIIVNIESLNTLIRGMIYFSPVGLILHIHNIKQNG